MLGTIEKLQKIYKSMPIEMKPFAVAATAFGIITFGRLEKVRWDLTQLQKKYDEMQLRVMEGERRQYETDRRVAEIDAQMKIIFKPMFERLGELGKSVAPPILPKPKGVCGDSDHIKFLDGLCNCQNMDEMHNFVGDFGICKKGPQPKPSDPGEPKP